MTTLSINGSQQTNRWQAKEEQVSKKYANFFLDFTFKRVFGNEKNKDIVISFLKKTLTKYHLKEFHVFL